MNTMAKFPLMILSFFLSILLWVYVQVQEHPTKPAQTTYPVQIEITNLPSEYYASSPGEFKFFPVGAQDELQQIRKEDLSAFVDLSNAKVGTFAYPVRLVVKGDYGVTWQPADPEVFITVQRKKEKVVEVRVQVAGDLDNPDFLYLPDSTYTEPRFIKVTGPESEVDKVTAARAILDLTRVSPGKTYESEIELLQDDDRPAPDSVVPDARTVVIHPAVAVGLEFRRLPIRASYRGNPAPGYVLKGVTVTPSDIQVRGRSEDLNGLTHLETLPEIDIAGLTESRSFTLTPKLPSQGISVVGQPTITARVVIEPATGSTRAQRPTDRRTEP